MTFTDEDIAAKGSRELQTRELTMAVAHSGDKVFACAVQFKLRKLRDA